MNDMFKKIDNLQKEIKSLRPLDENLVKQIKEYYRIGLTYANNALEGNSLTESETKVVLEDGITIGGKPLKDHYEAVGHSEAYDFIYSLAVKKDISEEEIKEVHNLFYKRIDEKNAGQYRVVKAIITGSKYPLPSPENIDGLMQKFIVSVNDLKGKKHPVELSALTHKEFVFIHPFVDGNGRVARLLMNLILFQEGYNIAIISPVLRLEYIQALERAHIDDKPFIKLIATAIYETQKDYLRMLK